MNARINRSPVRLGVALIAALVLFASVALPAAGAPGARGKVAPRPGTLFELTVLHVNDGESALLPTANTPGAARFVADLLAMQDEATRVDRLPANASARAKQVLQPRAALTISAGDNFLAGPRLNASFENPAAFYDALVYTRAGFDAMTLGNHEFDFGPDVLADFIEAAEGIPFVSANLDFDGEPRLATLEQAGRVAGSVVVEKSGRRIGVVGATTELLNLISSPRNVGLRAVLPAVQAEVAALEADGVDIILLSSHLQNLDEELALIGHLTGVDAVVGGGGGEALGDDYPLLATDAVGRTVPVVTTPGSYADIGKLVLWFDEAGGLVKVGDDSALVPVPLAGPRDAFIAQHVESPVATSVASLASNTIAQTEVALDGRRQSPGVRDRETNLGNLLADAMLLAARERAAAFGVPPADIALQNGGGMRQEAIIPVGPVTELDTFDIASFANFVSVAQVNGTELRRALERSVSALPGAGGFHGQWAGIQFNYDLSKTSQIVVPLTGAITQEGERIVDAVVTRADGSEVVLVDNGVLVAPDEVFTVASVSFILNGGDGYVSLKKPFTSLGLTYQQALADRFTSLGTVTATDYPDVSVDTTDYTRHGPSSLFTVN